MYKEVHPKETDKRDYILWIYCTYLNPDEIAVSFDSSHPLKHKHKANQSANNKSLVK